MKWNEAMKYTRELAKKSPYDIERDIGINHENIYRWEKEQAEPSIINCIKLADYYGVSLDELVGREYGHEEKEITQINAKYYNCKF